MTILLTAIGAGLVGLAAGFALRKLILLSQRSTLELELKEKRLQAKEKAADIKHVAEKEAEDIKKAAEKKAEKHTAKLEEAQLDATEKQVEITSTRKTLEEERVDLKEKKRNLDEQEKTLDKRGTELEIELAEVSGMSRSAWAAAQSHVSLTKMAKSGSAAAS
jgi:uncharacterized membrane protein YhiD involved in acid resistance